MSKYLKKFESVSAANEEGMAGLHSPHVDIIGDGKNVNFIKVHTEKFTCEFDENNKAVNIEPSLPQPEEFRALKFYASSETYIFFVNYKYTVGSPNIQYSYDKRNWTTLPSFAGGNSERLYFGSSEHPCLYVRGDNPQGFNNTMYDLTGINKTMIVSDYDETGIPVKVSGNAMWLIDYTQDLDEFPVTESEGERFFANFDSLFRPDKANISHNAIANVDDLIFPAKHIHLFGYQYLFKSCMVEKGPQILAEGVGIGTDGLLRGTFEGCENINEIYLTRFIPSVYVGNMVNSSITEGTLYVAPGTHSEWENRGAVPSTWTIKEVLGMVDLGLPSGTKWANMNLGAESPEDAGKYYAWAGTTGDTGEGTYDFSWENCPYNNGQSESNPTKYNSEDGKLVLEPDDDAATVALGSDYRMPTNDECQELFDGTTRTRETINGKTCVRFTSKTNGNSIVIPCCGYRDGSSLSNFGINAYVWSSSVYADWPESAHCIRVGGIGMASVETNSRYYGCSVRPVSASL